MDLNIFHHRQVQTKSRSRVWDPRTGSKPLPTYSDVIVPLLTVPLRIPLPKILIYSEKSFNYQCSNQLRILTVPFQNPIIAPPRPLYPLEKWIEIFEDFRISTSLGNDSLYACLQKETSYSFLHTNINSIPHSIQELHIILKDCAIADLQIVVLK